MTRSSKYDAGFTLPEMLVSMLIFSLLAMMAGGVIISTSLAERTIRSVTGGTTEGQLAVDSIETGIRNSSAFKVVAVGTDQLVLARIPRGANNVIYNCAAWYFDSGTGTGTGTISYKESSTTIATPSASVLSTWTQLASKVDTASGTAFIVNGDTLEIVYEVSAGTDYPPTTINTSVNSRAEVTESSPCF